MVGAILDIVVSGIIPGTGVRIGFSTILVGAIASIITAAGVKYIITRSDSLQKKAKVVRLRELRPL